MARKNDTNYFDMFIDGVSCAGRAVELMTSILNDYRPETLKESLHAMHEVEHAGDSIRHELIRRLLKEFITPIEREDIIELATEIDNLIDSLEDVLIGLYIFNIQTVRPDAVKFMDIVARCCTVLKSATQEFHNFRKSDTLRDKIIEINHIEEDGDALYIEAVRRLYTENVDPVSVGAWTTLYARLEKCCDCCEDIADTMESVMLKNS